MASVVAKNARLAALLTVIGAAGATGCRDCPTPPPVSADEVDDALDFLGMENAADCIAPGESQAGEYVNGADAFGNPRWDAYVASRPEVTCDGLSVNGAVASFAGEFYPVDLTVTTEEVTYQVGENEEYGPFQGNEQLQAVLMMDTMVNDTHPVTFWYYDTNTSTVWGADSMVVSDCEQVTDNEIVCETTPVDVELE